jgi:hypothetical protein
LKHSEVLPPVGPPPFEIIVDNGDPGTSSTGTWLVSGGANPYGANSLYTKEASIPDLREKRETAPGRRAG